MVISKDCQKQIIQLLFLILDFAPFSKYSDDFSHGITLVYDKLLWKIFHENCFFWSCSCLTQTLIQPFILDSGNWRWGIKWFSPIFQKKRDLSRKKLRDILVFTKGTYLQKRSIIISIFDPCCTLVNFCRFAFKTQNYYFLVHFTFPKSPC